MIQGTGVQGTGVQEVQRKPDTAQYNSTCRVAAPYSAFGRIGGSCFK